MKISNEQLSANSLADMGLDAVRLLRAGDFSGIADRYGYALALGRTPHVAIAQDLSIALATLQVSGLSDSVHAPAPRVSYFKENRTGLFALVAIDVETVNGKELLVELIVTAQGNDKWITLEDITPSALT